MTRWPEGWRVALDEHWTITVNGQRTPITVSVMGGPFEVPPYHCVVEYHGWLAGLFSPFGGELAAGVAANEDTFLTALRAAI